MANNNIKKNAETARLERIKAAEQKQKNIKKKKIIITVAAITLAIAAIVGITLFKTNDYTGTYYSGSDYITLHSDGNFSAILPHSVTKTGTYEINGTTIIFNVNNQMQNGNINGKSLTIPHEWDDGHGHSTVFRKNIF